MNAYVENQLNLSIIIHGTLWFGRFDVIGKMFQIEEANADIALAMARLDDEDMGHFSPQKSARIKRTGYTQYLYVISDLP